MARTKKNQETSNTSTPALTPEQTQANHIWKSQMRAAIVKAHNDGNRKAIDRQRVADADVDNAVFLQWQNDVDKLHGVVFNYVSLKKDARFDASISEADVRAARELIFPKWKELLRYCDSTPKELHVNESDVEDLYKFAWEFFNVEGKGTVETSSSPTEFRRNVEAFIGCAIAANKVMTLDDKTVIDKYQKAQRAQANALDEITELAKTVRMFDELLETAQDKVKTYLESQKAETEQALKQAQKNKEEAQAIVSKYAEKAQKIADKVQKAKEEPIND